MHRDLKPANVMLRRDGSLAIGDFGLSIDVGRVSTASMAAMGTLVFSAPEVVRRERPGLAADVYSYGMLLYELLFRRPPFSDTPLNPLIAAVRAAYHGARPSLARAPLPELVPLVESCWHAEPARRPSFVRILETLEGLRDRRTLGSRLGSRGPS
eukprot:tig00021537_g22314.t1